MFISKLPDRLSNDEIRELFKKYHETGNEEYREKLIAHNLKLVAYIVYEEFGLLDLDKDDLFSCGVVGLIKAVDKYDFDTGYAFATFATVCIRNEILMYFRKERKNLFNYSINSFIFVKDGEEFEPDIFMADENTELEEKADDHDIFLILCQMMEKFNERDKKVIQSFFGIGTERLNQKKIAEKFDISQSYVSRIIKNSISYLRNELINTYGYSLTKKI